MKTLHKTATAALLAAAGAAALLAACSGVTEPNGTQTPAISGVVQGGQAPVTGSSVTLLQANAGSAPTTIASAISDSNGNFSLSFACNGAAGSTGSLGSAASDGWLYVSSFGGNPGAAAGTNNTALLMMAALGRCGSLPASVNLNEVTTAAAAYALSGFTSVTPASQTVPQPQVVVQASSTNLTGLQNAFVTAAVLADPTTGAIPANADSTSYLAASQQKLYSLANALAACVNTTDGSSAQCALLFSCAMPGAGLPRGTATCTSGTGTVPKETLSAALNVVHYPGTVSRGGIYITAGRNVVFSPALGSQPNDWTLGLNFTGGLNTPDGIAIDSRGNVWVTSRNSASVSLFSASGAPVAGSPYTGNGLTAPYSLAVDASDNVWVGNNSSALVGAFDKTGLPLAGSPYTAYARPDGNTSFLIESLAVDTSGQIWGSASAILFKLNAAGQRISPDAGYPGVAGLTNSAGTAIDASGNVWVVSNISPGNALNEFNPAGTAISPSSGYTGGGMQTPIGLAIDANGTLWTASNASGANSLNAFGPTGAAISPSSGYIGGGLNQPFRVAIDGMGNVWTANQGGSNSLSAFSNSGRPLSPGGSGFTGGGISGSVNVAIDASGNVWAVNQSGNSLTKLGGAAAPTRVPLVSQRINAVNGNLNLTP